MTSGDIDIIKGMIERLTAILSKSETFGDHDTICLGGSLSKGTAVKNQTDADVIIFKKPPKSGR